MKNMFARLGCSEALCEAIVNHQGIYTLSDLMDFAMNSSVKDLCYAIRKPGGGEPGVPVPSRIEAVLVGTAWYLKLSRNISQPRRPADITLVEVRKYEAMRLKEKKYEEPDRPKGMYVEGDWTKTFENMEEFYAGC